jgi:hypothetical protein
MLPDLSNTISKGDIDNMSCPYGARLAFSIVL